MTLIREFAIEPAALNDWGSFRYVFEKLGFAEARLGVRLPEDWAANVLKACRDDVERKRIEEVLRKHYQTHFVAAPLLGGQKPRGWHAVVSAAHARRPLAGVVVRTHGTTEPTGVPVSTVQELSEEFLATQREAAVPSTGKALARVARELVRLSPRIVMVDPYFKVTSAGWRDTFKGIVAIARQERCEYLDIVTREESCPRDPERTLHRFFADAIGGNSRPIVEIRFLGPSTSGDRLHHRFLLSEIGAIRYDRGFEALGDNVTADVGVVDRTRHAELVNTYMHARNDFPLIYTFRWPPAQAGARLSAAGRP